MTTLSIASNGFLGGTSLAVATNGFLGNLTLSALRRRGTGGKLQLVPHKLKEQVMVKTPTYSEDEDICLLLLM